MIIAYRFSDFFQDQSTKEILQKFSSLFFSTSSLVDSQNKPGRLVPREKEQLATAAE